MKFYKKTQTDLKELFGIMQKNLGEAIVIEEFPSMAVDNDHGNTSYFEMQIGDSIVCYISRKLKQFLIEKEVLSQQ